ncbi:hypothetical protein [Microcystis aeruginosa]|uniref:hypothetical protein n=1 Tax=Microcystis aeruginosa TaxID=1126 RepID=UPI0007764EDA|nr:hypothetical protein [Microcystis aeruginosa]KXS91265.1 hypothetical protein OA58_09875 [Microcystis aeruginosa NIES-88]BCU14069.1 hypothetical protein MAN88_46330 [Microcystis aeruginosa]
MNFVLLRSNIFIRNARKIVKKQAFLVQNIQETLALLSVDPGSSVCVMQWRGVIRDGTLI